MGPRQRGLTDAEILLLDESFSGGLDPAGILALERILRRRTSVDNKTVVFTTPVPELVEGTADRLIVLQEGKVAADERLADLRARTGNASVTQPLQTMFFEKTLNKLDRYFGEEPVVRQLIPASTLIEVDLSQGTNLVMNKVGRWLSYAAPPAGRVFWPL